MIDYNINLIIYYWLETDIMIKHLIHRTETKHIYPFLAQSYNVLRVRSECPSLEVWYPRTFRALQLVVIAVFDGLYYSFISYLVINFEINPEIASSLLVLHLK